MYLAPKHLPDYIQIPTWGQSEYSVLVAADALDPVLRLGAADPGQGSCSAPAGFDPVKPGKYDLIRTGTSTGQIAQRWLCPGVYHFVPTNGQQGLQLGSGTTVAGEGVTLVFETGPNHNADDSDISVQSGSSLLLNSGSVPGTSHMDAPWTTGDPRHDVPIAIWIKPIASCPAYPVPSCSASSVFNMGSGSGLDIGGVIFGPTDNIVIAGNGAHHGAGEIWSWTIEYVGNSQLDQTYAGTDEGWPVLVE